MAIRGISALLVTSAGDLCQRLKSSKAVLLWVGSYWWREVPVSEAVAGASALTMPGEVLTGPGDFMDLVSNSQDRRQPNTMPQKGAVIPKRESSDTVIRKQIKAPVAKDPENPARNAFFKGVSMARPASAATNEAGMASAKPTNAGAHNPTQIAPSALTIPAA